MPRERLVDALAKGLELGRDAMRSRSDAWGAEFPGAGSAVARFANALVRDARVMHGN